MKNMKKYLELIQVYLNCWLKKYLIHPKRSVRIKVNFCLKKCMVPSNNLLYYYNSNNFDHVIADMQKFPLRMKDNDLLVTELYRDPSCDPITAISVYLTPKTSKPFLCLFLS